MIEKIKYITARLLITFSLISVGFMWGKHSSSEKSTNVSESTRDDCVQVYYMHGTFRCATCNTIEKMTRELLDDSYSEYLERTNIRWKEVNFQENTELAEKFNVIASCVVVAVVKEGEIVEFERLDDVWTKMKDPAAFNLYVGDVVDKSLREVTTL